MLHIRPELRTRSPGAIAKLCALRFELLGGSLFGGLGSSSRCSCGCVGCHRPPSLVASRDLNYLERAARRPPFIAGRPSPASYPSELISLHTMPARTRAAGMLLWKNLGRANKRGNRFSGRVGSKHAEHLGSWQSH